MSLPAYTALIRTYNSAATLPRTLASLSSQRHAPEHIVFVDSGSTDNTLSLLPMSSTLHRYTGGEFNYSAALNQGIQHVETPYVLVISSHTSLDNPSAVEFALNILSDDRVGAAYFCHDDAPVLSYEAITAENFDGFNGIWNTCSVIKMSHLRKRPFRMDVFAAEDLEWSRWLLCESQYEIARVSGARLEINNNRLHAHGRAKRLNDYVSVAYFSNRKLLGGRNLALIAARAIIPTPGKTCLEQIFWCRLFFRLIACHFRKPSYSSRYFI